MSVLVKLNEQVCKKVLQGLRSESTSVLRELRRKYSYLPYPSKLLLNFTYMGKDLIKYIYYLFHKCLNTQADPSGRAV